MKTQTDTNAIRLHSDSLLRISKSPLNPSPLEKTIPDISIDKPEIKKEIVLRKIKKTIPAGTISAGYDYGFLPYTVNSSVPATAFKTEGQISLNVFNIPIDVTYYYTDQKNLIGLNNYFRISYNADRYKENLNKNLDKDAYAYKTSLGPLMNERQKLLQKVMFNQYLLNTDQAQWPDVNKNCQSLTDSLKKTKPFFGSNDSISTPDSLNKKPVYKEIPSTGLKLDSVPQHYSDSSAVINKRDSVLKEYNFNKLKYDSVDRTIKDVQKKIDMIEQFQGYKTVPEEKSYTKELPFLSKVQNFMQCVKKLDIGLCYPSNSGFLVNSVPVRGLNFELAKNNLYLNFTYGTVVSSLLYSNQNLQGFLRNLNSTYNSLDFGNVEGGRKILSAKFGIGSKESNHLHFGFLFGKGLSSYAPVKIGENNPGSDNESNFVIEIDAKYKLGKVSFFEIITAKSSIKGEDLSYDCIKAGFDEIFSRYRSNAILTKLSTKIKASKTDLSLSVRWVDPFFKSYGTGFIRSDNMRYELKLSQPISKSLKYSGMIRYEEDNLLRLLNYRNTFLSFNNSLSYKIRRGLQVRVCYTPLFRTLNAEGYKSENNSSISTAVVSYAPILKKYSAQFNLIFNYYNIKADTLNVNFKNLAYTHQFNFKKGLKTSLNLSWFNNDTRDTLNNNNIWLGVLDIGYNFKKGSSISIGGKSAYKINGIFYPGFILKSNTKLFNKLFWEASIEKFIVGDLFNGYDLQSLKKFPYLCSTRLTYNF